MIQLPLNNQWTQRNSSYKAGSLWSTKNITLDEEGIIKLSPRMVNMFDNSETVANVGSTNFGIPVAFGRSEPGTFYLGTTDEPFNVDVSSTTKTIAEDTTSNNPNMSSDSHACWWQNRWYASTSTTVSYNDSGTWTANVISSLTSGVRHWLTVFKNRRTLCVSNGNTIKQYDTSHSNTVDLTLPTDFEVTGMAYNNYKLGIVTRQGANSEGQNSNAFFFVWNGATSEASSGIDIGSTQGLAVVPYKSSFVILTIEGQLLYFNGGGFDELARFPFYISESRSSDFLNYGSYGDIMSSDGDIIYINIGFDLSGRGIKREQYLTQNPMGTWCYDPKAGLYHRYSPSLSRYYQHTIAEADVNLSTNVFTTSGVIPATGNPIVLTDNTVGGLTMGVVYYVIRLTSTTFAVAETKELADAGSKIDITSKSSGQSFAMYDIVDYGASYDVQTGAVALWGDSSIVYRDIVSGCRIKDTTDSNVIVLNTTVQQLENRGYFVLPKLFLSSQTEKIQNIVVKYRPLDISDAIVVKVKSRDYLNVPSSTPSGVTNIAEWSSGTVFTTSADLSEVKALFDIGNEIEIELTTGAGAGQLTTVTSMSYSTGVYTVTVSETIVGAASGKKSHFVLDNWTTFATINADNQGEGFYEVLVGTNGKAPQIKVELRGYDTAVEDILINSTTHKPSV
jgi:hypothetical protein